MSSQDLTAFLEWANENCISWDKDAIEIREGKHGLGVYAKKDLDVGDEVIQVPKSIVLSVKNTGIANLLDEDDIEGYVGLTLACMYELSKGSESVWSAYLALLYNRRPQMVNDLPEDAREAMKKCEVYEDSKTDLKDIREDFDTIVVPFLDKHAEVFTDVVKSKFFSFEDFKTVTSLVSSRAMDVDNYHDSALVPFADFVNHNAEPNSDYLTHEDVCEVCGALSCEHLDEQDDDDDDDEETPELTAEDATESNKKRTAAKKAEAEAKGEEATDGGDDDDADWEDEDINDTCDIILDDDVKKGEEISRHYGPFPNKFLLSKYGFAEVDNPHDTVTVQLDMVKKAAEGILNDSALVEERVKWFLDTEDVFIGEDDEDCDEECCDGEAHSGHEHKHEKKEAATAAEEDEDEDEDEEEDEDEDEDEDDFPRDIMYMTHDGSIDDRMLMLLNVIFMEKEQFTKVQESMEVATEYFNDIFLRRALEEDPADDEADEDVDDEEKPEVKPLDETGRKVRKAVLETLLQVIRLRADAFGVSDATTAEDDLEVLKKADLSGLTFYGEVCVQGEKQILQNGLKLYSKFHAAL